MQPCACAKENYRSLDCCLLVLPVILHKSTIKTLNVTGPRKRALNAVYLESIFVVESDKAFFQLQNDTKIDLLGFLSGDMFEGVVRAIATPS